MECNAVGRVGEGGPPMGYILYVQSVLPDSQGHLESRT